MTGNSKAPDQSAAGCDIVIVRSQSNFLKNRESHAVKDSVRFAIYNFGIYPNRKPVTGRRCIASRWRRR